MSNLNDFRDYISKVQPEEFLRYESASPQKRLEFLTFIDEIGIRLEGKQVLEIGPAYGDALDICREKGAQAIDFIDYDPIFFAYNRLKGFRGYKIDHRISLMRLERKRYDFIWAKGSISGDFFITPSKLGLRWLSHWLAQVDNLSSSEYQIAVTPHYALKTGKRERICADVFHNPFAEVMLNNGYTILKKIRYLNDSIHYPITFFKSSSST